MLQLIEYYKCVEFAAKLAIKQKIYQWVDDDDVKIKWYIERDIIRMWDASVYLYRYATIPPSFPFNQNKIDENWIIMCCLLGRSVVGRTFKVFLFFFLFMLINLKTSRNSFMSHLSVKSKSNVFLTQIIDISHRVFIRCVFLSNKCTSKTLDLPILGRSCLFCSCFSIIGGNFNLLDGVHYFLLYAYFFVYDGSIIMILSYLAKHTWVCACAMKGTKNINNWGELDWKIWKRKVYKRI